MGEELDPRISKLSNSHGNPAALPQGENIDRCIKPQDSLGKERFIFREQNQELWIGNIHKGFEGTYTCRADNRYGSTETKVYVKVMGR